ncbi:MAG: ubiquinone biosynthesis protein [Anaerolineae bacterium]|nr:ubiquinone biosynthesis protein [Anaerolineae bacterium]
MDEQEIISRWRAEEAQPFEGWDFSYLRGRYSEDRPSFSYEGIVRAHLKNADAVLDMGTGGGEKLLEFKDVLPDYVFATEGYPPNIPVAKANLEPHGIQVVAYDVSTDPVMPFADACLPLVINRHEAYDADEIARILTPGGVFVTQQVDGYDLADLRQILNLPLEYTHVTLDNCRTQLERVGLNVEQAYDWSGYATFADVAALVYFLRAIMPETFSVDRHVEALLLLHRWQKPLRFAIKRFLLLARKPA